MHCGQRCQRYDCSIYFFCLKTAFAAFKVGIVKGKPLVEIKAPVKGEGTGKGHGYVVVTGQDFCKCGCGIGEIVTVSGISGIAASHQ
jgi:hypothetical protein